MSSIFLKINLQNCDNSLIIIDIMSVLFFSVPIALILAFIFVGAFIWSTKKGQFDDLDTPAHKMLLEDEEYIEDEEDKKDKEQKNS